MDRALRPLTIVALLAAAFAAQAQTRQPWPAGDEIGMANTLGPATWQRCATYLTAPNAKAYELSYLRSNTMPQSPFAVPLRENAKPTVGIPGTRHAFNTDEVASGDPNQQGTQMDAIGHFAVLPEAWEGFDRAGVLAFWQTVMPAHEQKKKVFVDDEVLCTLFERLADATEPVKVNFRFVLGLILMRKRLIVYDDARKEDGRDVWVVHMKGKEEKLLLTDPKLDEQQVTEVSQQLGEILNQEM